MVAAGIHYGRQGDGVVLHSLRHSYATWLLENGVPVTIVARLLGDTVPVLLRTYAHRIPDQEQLATDVLVRLTNEVTR